MQSVLASVRRKMLPKVERLDGRSSAAKRIKTVIRQLRRECDCGNRWTNVELGMLARTARAIVLAEQAQVLAQRGELALSDALRAEAAGRRSVDHLKRVMQQRRDEGPGLDEMLLEGLNA